MVSAGLTWPSEEALYKQVLMDTTDLSNSLKALAVPSRLKIMELLRTRSYCVHALTMRLDISQPAVSQHLAVLKRAGFVDAGKDGTMVHYCVNMKRFEQVITALGAIGTCVNMKTDV
jgi:ArsR family transcriptional regulator, arsenate/arsenite/antimonite-responsive transcriptional repressor